MKKEIEVTKLDLRSVFRVVVIMSLIPGLLIFLASLLQGEFVLWTVIVTPIASGISAVIGSFIYNLVAKNFGGIRAEIHLDDC